MIFSTWYFLVSRSIEGSDAAKRVTNSMYIMSSQNDGDVISCKPMLTAKAGNTMCLTFNFQNREFIEICTNLVLPSIHQP